MKNFIVEKRLEMEIQKGTHISIIPTIPTGPQWTTSLLRRSLENTNLTHTTTSPRNKVSVGPQQLWRSLLQVKSPMEAIGKKQSWVGPGVMVWE